jgi:hypothetical protein
MWLWIWRLNEALTLQGQTRAVNLKGFSLDFWRKYGGYFDNSEKGFEKSGAIIAGKAWQAVTP